MLESLKGELRVYSREVEYKGKTTVLFSTCICATKNEDESYTNYWINVKFANSLKKDVAKVYTDKCFDIIMKDGWLKCYETKDGVAKLELFVNKATVLSADEKEDKKSVKKTTKSKQAQDDDSLPF